jgi:hypothetical protein
MWLLISNKETEMKKLIVLAMLFVMPFAFTGCLWFANTEPYGLIYSNVGDISPRTTVVTSKLGSKVGVSKSFSWFGLFAFGDSGIAQAAASAGIEKIETVDVNIKNVLFIYVSKTTIVTGD